MTAELINIRNNNIYLYGLMNIVHLAALRFMSVCLCSLPAVQSSSSFLPSGFPPVLRLLRLTVHPN